MAYGMFFIIFIIAIIGLICVIESKDKEIKKLKANGNSENVKTIIKNVGNIKFCPECGCDLRPYSGTQVVSHNHAPVVNEQPKTVVNEEIKPPVVESKPKYTDKEVKNSLILITGSVLVILSALLFLTTTWNFTNNIIKTLLLVIMLIVFFAASHIAENVLHLKQTAKAFRYIGLYFLPIVLFSISLFSLLGYNLSINGPNKYVYLFFSSLIVTGVYYYSSVKYNSTLIKVSTILFSVIALIMGTLIFTSNSIKVMIVLNIYAFILCFLYTSNKIIFDRNIHLKTLITLLAAFFIISVNILLLDIMFMTYTDIVLDIIMFINAYYFFCKVINKKKIFENIYPIYLIIMSIHIGGLFDGYLATQQLILASFGVVVITELLIHKSMSLGSYIEVIASSSLVYLFTLLYRIFNTECIEAYFFTIAIGLVSLIHFISNRKRDGMRYKFSAYIFSASVLVSILNIILVHDLSKNYLGFASLGMILLLNMYKKRDDLSKSFEIVGNIGFILSTFMMNYSDVFTSVLLLFYSVHNMFLYFDKGYKLSRYPSYIYYNLHLISLLMYYNKNLFLITNDLYLIIPITTIIFVIAEKLIPKLADQGNHLYILLQFALSLFLLVGFSFTIPNMILFIIICLEFIYYVKSIDYAQEWLLLPYSAIISYLNIKTLPLGYSYFSSVFNYLSLGMFAIFGYLIFKKKRIMCSVLYYLNAFLYIVNYHPNKYFGLLLVVIGTSIAYIVKRGRRRDLFKTGLFVCGLVLARFIIHDLDLESFTMINIGVYVLWVPLVTRLIIRKYSIIGCKIAEYTANVIINLVAFFSYTSEYDGLLFVLLLMLVIIVSYAIKLGPVFLVSSVSIILNVFVLTREFWLAIPWWIYVLIIGIILISFAVYNEINANKRKNNVIKEISKKIDL